MQTDLATAIRLCRKCEVMANLRDRDGTTAVPAEVGEDAGPRPLAVMCEAPGEQEAATSRPLVGKAGQLFNELLNEAGLYRTQLVLLNRVRCRPPNNNLRGVPEAIGNCEEWLWAELEAYDPAVVVLMGAPASSLVFPGKPPKIGAIRGTTRETMGRMWVPTYHPASLFPHRSPWNREVVVEDLIYARELWASQTSS